MVEREDWHPLEYNLDNKINLILNWNLRFADFVEHFRAAFGLTPTQVERDQVFSRGQVRKGMYLFLKEHLLLYSYAHGHNHGFNNDFDHFSDILIKKTLKDALIEYKQNSTDTLSLLEVEDLFFAYPDVNQAELRQPQGEPQCKVLLLINELDLKMYRYVLN